MPVTKGRISLPTYRSKPYVFFSWFKWGKFNHWKTKDGIFIRGAKMIKWTRFGYLTILAKIYSRTCSWMICDECLYDGAIARVVASKCTLFWVMLWWMPPHLSKSNENRDCATNMDKDSRDQVLVNACLRRKILRGADREEHQKVVTLEKICNKDFVWKWYVVF